MGGSGCLLLSEKILADRTWTDQLVSIWAGDDLRRGFRIWGRLVSFWNAAFPGSPLRARESTGTPSPGADPELQGWLPQLQPPPAFASSRHPLCCGSQPLSWAHGRPGNHLSRTLRSFLHGSLLSGMVALESCLPWLSPRSLRYHVVPLLFLFVPSFCSCSWRKEPSDSCHSVWPEQVSPLCILTVASCLPFVPG